MQPALACGVNDDRGHAWASTHTQAEERMAKRTRKWRRLAPADNLRRLTAGLEQSAADRGGGLGLWGERGRIEAKGKSVRDPDAVVWFKAGREAGLCVGLVG